MQCVGAILIAPLIKRFNTRSVLAGAILGFCVLTVILLICDGNHLFLPSHGISNTSSKLRLGAVSGLMSTTMASITPMPSSRTSFISQMYIWFLPSFQSILCGVSTMLRLASFSSFSSRGIAYGMVELIRRVIPRDIVGGNVGKLKRMDSVVHGGYPSIGSNKHPILISFSHVRSGGYHWRCMFLESV